jgi:hypothetical protein
MGNEPAVSWIAWPRARGLLRSLVPYVLFGALLAFGWRAWDLVHALPYYEDVLEVTWTIKWYDGAIRGLHGAGVNPLVFFPTGWQVATFADGPAMFLLLLPLNWLGGAAFAYNCTLWLTFLIAFIGARQLARRYVEPLPALVAALLFAFWGYRWYGFVGHLNIMLASALMPWMVVTVENALTSPRRRLAWLVVTGLLWALMIASSLYFVWLGGLLLAGWLAGRVWSGSTQVRAAVVCLGVPIMVALLTTAPLLVWFLHASDAAHAVFYEIPEIGAWDASLNSFPAPSVSHPWLQPLARWIYRGPTNEPGQTNFGLLAFSLAVIGAVSAWRRTGWRPIILITALGLLLALGLTLKWDGDPVHWSGLRPLDTAIWALGHRIKPEVFTSVQPPPPFDTAVPLPGLLLSAIVPWWDRARVFARYVLLASMGLFLLAGFTLTRIRWTWARYLLAALLIFEVVPGPTENRPFPPQPHPAFAWLAQQNLAPGGGVIDLGSWQPTLAYIPIGGATLWAADFHGKPTLAGASSVLPAHVVFLVDWLANHPQPFKNTDLVPILRFFGVRYILFHVTGGSAREVLADGRANPDIKSTNCFEPAAGPGPWRYPICIMELTPAPADSNLLLRNGWSGAEGWGRWMEGTEASADWVAATSALQRLSIAAFPECVPGRQQSLSVVANGVEVGRHEWSACEPWSGEVLVPASLVRIGWNHLALRSAYAARPTDVDGTQNGDTRPLSVGFNRLHVDAAK